MPLNNNCIQGLLQLLLENTDFANVGDATGLRGSSSAGSFYLSLHTADPGAAGNQATSEVSYTGYVRLSITRAAGTWTITGNTLSPTATFSFAPCTGGAATATYAGIGTASSGSGELLWSGAITPSIAISNGITPELTTGSTATLA